MADKYPDVIPMIAYADGVAALEWLSRAFGFVERARMVGDDGRLAHGEMEVDGTLVYVLDVDAHFARAKRQGAVILSELEPGPPARRYRAEDLEGHRWMFMQRD
ncbi:MAG TPA: hypothetical protein VH438_15065 [Gemmatimonadales bacterium]|jgi:uncharacterized glyoxalase superfamily protein PhnB